MGKRRTRLPQKTAKETCKKGPKRFFTEQDLKDTEELVGKAGARNKDLAEFFGVSVKSIEVWTRKYRDFRKAVHRGRIKCVLPVAKSLYMKATGFHVPSEKIFMNEVKEYDENGNVIKSYKEPLRVPTWEYFAPDANAAYKFLTIQHREVWADVQNWNVNHNHSGEITHKQIKEINTEGLSESAQSLVYELTKKQIEEGQNVN